MTIECIELQGETLAFHFICGVFCLVGWGSRLFGSRCTYRYRTICMDWHCWYPTVCLRVSQVFAICLLRAYTIVCSLHCLCLPSVAYNVGDIYLALLQWADLLDVPLWRLTWQVCMARKMRYLKANMTWAHWWKFNIYRIVVIFFAQSPPKFGTPVNSLHHAA